MATSAMADDLGADLDQLLLQARQRPVFDRLWRRRNLRLARIALGGYAIFMLPPARARADNLTPGTGRLAADNPTIVAQFCVQVRKIAIRIRMTAITATALLVSVTNVRYICS
jgi:hypothetical protein